MRRALILLSIALVACACTPEPQPAIESCQELVVEVVDALQEYVDEFAGMTPEEFMALPPPQLDLEERAERIQGRADELGCDPEEFDRLLIEELERLEAEGPVATAIADVLERGLVDPARRPAEEITLGPADDLETVVAGAGPGSTIVLEEGEYRLGSPLLLTRSLTIAGAGVEETRIVSEAAGVALIYVGEGDLRLEDLTVAHEGDEPASVVLIRSGSGYLLDGVRLSGALADEEGLGGAGLLVGSPTDQPLEGDPDRSMVVRDSELLDNQGAGILIAGEEAPTVEGNRVEGSQGCGICFQENSTGTASDNEVAGNQVGIAVQGEAAPVVEGNRITGNSETGLFYDGTASGTARDNTIEENGNAGLIVSGQANPEIIDNRVAGHAVVGIGLLGENQATVSENRIEDNGLGVELAESARSTVEGNRIVGAEEAGIRVGDQAAPTVRGNDLSGEIPAGLIIRDEASPSIEENTIANQGLVGIVYAADGAGAARANHLEGQEVGIQVADSAAPELVENTLTGQTEVAILFTDQAGGRAEGNVCPGAPVGIALLGSADPELADNQCQVVDQREE